MIDPYSAQYRKLVEKWCKRQNPMEQTPTLHGIALDEMPDDLRLQLSIAAMVALRKKA